MSQVIKECKPPLNHLHKPLYYRKQVLSMVFSLWERIITYGDS